MCLEHLGVRVSTRNPVALAAAPAKIYASIPAALVTETRPADRLAWCMSRKVTRGTL